MTQNMNSKQKARWQEKMREGLKQWKKLEVDEWRDEVNEHKEVEQVQVRAAVWRWD